MTPSQLWMMVMLRAHESVVGPWSKCVSWKNVGMEQKIWAELGWKFCAPVEDSRAVRGAEDQG